MKNKLNYLIFMLALLVHFTSSSQQTVSLSDLLKDMIDTRSTANWASPVYVLKQASSYDRRSKSPTKPGWFANENFLNIFV